MEQEILTSTQKKIIAEVAKEPDLKDFYLSGGTALAVCYLQHRFSDDLDFFIFDEPDRAFLHGFAEKLKGAIGADDFGYEKLYDRSLFYFRIGEQEQKLEFTRYPFKQLEKTMTWNGIRIDSLRDIAANKMMAMLDRFDPKDFVDLYFLLQQFKLEDIRVDVQTKFGAKIENLFFGSELAKVRRVEALPRMVKELEISVLKDFFEKQAKKLENKILE